MVTEPLNYIPYLLLVRFVYCTWLHGYIYPLVHSNRISYLEILVVSDNLSAARRGGYWYMQWD
jgi:hypothetical protein